MRTTDTKERLIKAALDLFSENGYEGTSVDQIAKAVEIKAPSIYAHFKMFAESATGHLISNIKSLFTPVFKRMMDEGTMARCNPEIAALEFMAPVSLLIQLCDRTPDKEGEVMAAIEEHIDIFIERWINT